MRFSKKGSAPFSDNRSAFDRLSNPGIAEELIHEMFHAAGLHGSDPSSGFLGTGRPNDLNQEVQWDEIARIAVMVSNERDL